MLSAFKTPFFVFLLLLKCTISTPPSESFIFNGFTGANLKLDGIASITSDGLLKLTNATRLMKGHAFHPNPLKFKSPAGKTLSFSTTFVFAILSEISDVSGHGIAFVVSPTTNLSSALQSQYLGLFNMNNNGNASNHVFAVELDTILNSEFKDISDNHVGIDVNSLKSSNSHDAGYYDNKTGVFKNLTLMSGQPMQLWVDFKGEEMELNVTLSPIRMPKPKKPLLSTKIDLSSLMLDLMYVGFSSATGSFHTTHCVLGWSFKMNGESEKLDYDRFPPLPRNKNKVGVNVLEIWLPMASSSFVLFIIIAVYLIVRRRRKYAELLEDWEIQYGPHRFSYKDLFQATKGFKEKELLGTGGFGRVYKGVLSPSKIEVAVKRVSHESRQGMKEFVAEIVSIGQLRHRNIVQLLGYCRRKGELLLVYDFMPNGSLDKFLYDKRMPTLRWVQRFKIIKGVASGLLYLHAEWEKVVVHRDIKASNVLLDSEMNGRLGDFGLARLYDHGSYPLTTHVVGTMGYLAPEIGRNGKATTLTDVYAFGVFLLEVVCGKRPVKPNTENGLVLMDYVIDNWKQGTLIETIDSRMTVEDYNVDEVELVLKLGLLCSHPIAGVRPSMRQVMQILDGDVRLPEITPDCLSFGSAALPADLGFEDYITSFCFISMSGGGR
ncbi:L-type lectin-domain containing receptor kinase IV.2-like [Asparagus officinalis]|uniref:L-type lectin-domain containing receptor kinase IV.2-like n=1 Tax=Asparagus officinalis TaxID=4686 RepID=UPI00098E6D88|nr:L-type lectin-domain containing receptor kinase IV.2-like [Asparagus officinalis]